MDISIPVPPIYPTIRHPAVLPSAHPPTMQRSDAAILIAAATTFSAAMMTTVALTIEVERQRQQRLSAKCRPQYRLPLVIPQGPDFYPVMFNESWAWSF